MLQIALIMLPELTKPPSKVIGYLVIFGTVSVLFFTIVPFSMGRLLASSTKVETAQRITKILYYNSIGLPITIVTSFVIAILYLSSLDSQGQIASVIVVSSIFRILWGAALLYLLLQTKKAAVHCKIQITNFHDFLIQYRQTPRSKILRKHLPSMDAVVEEESRYEQSAMSIISPRESG